MEKPKSERKQLIEKLDKEFSIFIRTRFADKNGFVRCFTCNRIGHWKLMDCGHFISRKKLATRWDEKNCQVQCKPCNLFSEGNKYIFGKQLNEKYGTGTAEMLQIKSNNIMKFGNFALKLLYKHYKRLNSGI